MKGILLAGGSGTRLYPSTKTISKQLLPIYDKPMIYYPLSTLMLAGIREILLITTPHEVALFQHLLGDGSQWGIKLEYRSQAIPHGIPESFIIGESFIGDGSVCLMLGDNILYGQNLPKILQSAACNNDGATVFACAVRDPERYGVISFDDAGIPISLEEKPKNPQSRYALIGLYFYDNLVIDFAKSLTRSQRGELEITEVNKAYLKANKLNVEQLGRGNAWFDAGTNQSMLEASQFIHIVERSQWLKIGAPEEVAWRMEYINNHDLEKLAETSMSSGYGQYLLGLLSS